MSGTTPAGRAGTGRRAVVDIVVLVAALALAVLPLVPVYAPGAAAPALAGGLLVGAGVAAAAARGRWSALPTVAVLLVVAVVAGGPLAAPTTTVAGVVPTGATVRTLLGGVVTVWKEMLTLPTPLGAGGGLLVAPYALALVGAAAAVSVALRARTGVRASRAAVVPAVVAVLAALLGVRETPVPVVAGVAAAAALVTWASARQGRLQPRRVLALGLAGVVVLLGGAVTGPVLAEPGPRFVLRERIAPPFDPGDLPSPLAGYRRFVKDWRDTELLTVHGLPPGADVRLATMDLYDGVVWDVADDAVGAGSGTFRRPAADGTVVGATPADGPTERVRVEVHALTGVWLPTVGRPQSVHLAGDEPGRAAQLRVDGATGAAVLTGGLTRGLRYTVLTRVPPVPDDHALAAARPASVALPGPRAVPEVVGLVAGELASDATTAAAQARALETGLVERGWFSHGLTEAGDHPSLSGHGADRMTALLGGELMVGDSEQYASAMALMARELGLPARVVLGFRAPDGGRGAEPVTFTGGDAEAWVEVAFRGHGWVPFHPTPDESRTPDDRTPRDRAEPDPQAVQPPPPVPEPVTPPEQDAEQPRTDEPADNAAGRPLWETVARVGAIGSVPIALLALPAVVLEGLRRRRRHRRRTADDAVGRVVGGWQEVLDTARDLAVPVVDGGTRRETAADLARRLGPAADPLAHLAAGADAAVFAPGAPADAEVDRYWETVDGMVGTLRATASRGRRLRSRWSTASLRRRPATHRRGARPPARPIPTSPAAPRASAPGRRDGEP